MSKVKPIPNSKPMLLGVLGVLLAFATTPPLSKAIAAADSYPTKSVRLIIPFAPGGSTDIVGRQMAAKLSERLGKQVVPENRSGGGGIVAAEMVARADADGYTLLFASSPQVIAPLLSKVPYDPVKSFVPIAKVGSGPAVVTVHPGVPANSVQELIALAKKQPGKLICGSSGVGSFVHLSSELFKMMAGIDFKILQFKGGGPAMIDVMGGHSQIMIGTLTMTMPQIKAGKLRALGYAGAARTKLMPELPTVSEAGLPGYEAAIWWGFFAPAGTPKEIVGRLYKEIAAIMNSEEMKQHFEKQGSDVDLMDSAGFSKFTEMETVKWGKVIKAGNIKEE
jgi:tripartite-type tricarboxylate transporter receptor subunit TctC